MTKAKPQALVIYGDGINCEDETAYALNAAGFESTKVHCVDILEIPEKLQQAQLLVFPGGFSFGDEIASGRVLAIKLKEKLQEALHRFIDRGSLVMAICNGFQILLQLEILPDSRKGSPRLVSLCHNEGGKFINKWVRLDVAPGTSRFFQGLDSIHLPIRHGEGRLGLPSDPSDQLEATVKKQAPLRYSDNVNGSYDRIAALTNQSDNVMGLMPHPEAFVRWNQHPSWGQLRYGRSSGELALKRDCDSELPHGLKIFMNAAAMLN